MKFDDFDKKMRQFEASLDERWPDDGFVVARLDGRGFTKLTKQKLDFQRPFDLSFHEAMTKTCEHLMDVGIRMIFGYSQSDEISLLLHPDENAYGRKTRKLNSVLAGEASGVFSLAVQHPTAFDCRICPLPDKQTVIDYFRWRAEDAKRNALSAFCYWILRNEGDTPNSADEKTMKLDKAGKLNLLKTFGVDFDSEPEWKRLGAIISWGEKTVLGENPLTGEMSEAKRRQLKWASPMPTGTDLSNLVRELIG